MPLIVEDVENISFEDALNKAGFGLYSYTLTCLAGVIVICYACIFYATIIVIPVSACDLQTTVAQQGMLAAGPTVGSILGAMVWGYLADQLGRRRMLMAALLCGAAVNALASLSVNWLMLLVLQFVAALMISGHYSLSMTLLSESVPMARRNLVVLLVTSIFFLSQGVMAVIAMPIIPLTFSYHVPYLDIRWNSWRLLLLIYSVPSVMAALWLFFMQESPKFLYSKGDHHKALDILRTIHKMNYRRGIRQFQVYQVKTLNRRGSHLEGSLAGRRHALSLFRSPLLKYTIIMTLLFLFEQIGSFKVWLPTIAHRFVEMMEAGQRTDLTLCDVIVLSLNENSPEDNGSVQCALNTSSLLIVLAISVTISVTNIGVTMLEGRMGRRYLAMIITAVTGMSGVLVNLVPNAFVSALLFVVQLLGIVVIGLYTAMCVSLFPTHLRALAVTLTMTCGKVVNFVSIQLINYLLTVNCELAFYLYGSVFAFSAVLVLLLPDDQKPSPSQHEILYQEGTSR